MEFLPNKILLKIAHFFGCLKEEIYQAFKANPKLEARCRKVKQIWITFYTQEQLDNNKDLGSVFIVMYHGQLYYTFLSGNYFPQMQLFDFFTKQLTSKWTNIKNLAPVMNKDTKQII